MPPESSDSTMGLLLSGGLDSSILLGYLLSQHRPVQPFYVQSQLVWQREERRAVGRLLRAMAAPRLAELRVLDLPLQDLYEDHWSVTGDGVPDGSSRDDAVYLPGRNALLLIKPALWCRLHGVRELALAVLQSNPFADATAAFFEGFQTALYLATGGDVCLVRPFGQLSKREVMDLGRGLPLELTFSCIAPSDGLHCGQCNKCAERRSAFRQSGIDDPTRYANPQTSKTPRAKTAQ